ncbi:hypothetical protein [Streptomyces acidiscabies]|uniref:Uncharacterized protein n=1 Tax=Streptomyces acidiscabies TaxID=42234 RepID=A0AAP6BKN7_9ACTN|nr:hypothetical protein [Streptomyces acidiscabies]MBZ3918151.1 hypothetical protein [Streptomyces acidiscabies]MDX2966451.1 hypothetical protein [Streptomyces acidiscabies]MDX3796397.1 hypothetical protein [Streptomyces acidiscabies]
MAARTPRRERAPRTYLPGIADVRICGDEATVTAVLDVLEREFRTTTAREYDGGQRAYLQLDTGCTDPDTD